VSTQEKDITVLGIDPGFSVTGFAILTKKAGMVHLCDWGYLKMSPKNLLSCRVGEFYTIFKQKISDHKVSRIALETSFLGKNPQTFLKLGYLRGILYLLADQHNLDLAEFAPREVKAAVTGFGAASKEQVAQMMFALFPKLGQFGTTVRNDVTDALAISICGVWHQQTHLQKLMSGKK